MEPESDRERLERLKRLERYYYQQHQMAEAKGLFWLMFVIASIMIFLSTL